MSAHTPGPWGFYGDNNYGGTVEIGPRLTASIDRADRFDSSMAISREEMEANGRLIAAAPALLSACEEMIRAFRPVYLDDVEQYPAQIRDEARAMLAAIAMARGKS